MIRPMTDEEEFQELARLIAETLHISSTLGGRSFTARPGFELQLQFVAGWFRHIEYTFEAVDLLLGSGYEHAVPPLLRLMLEDAVSAALVATDPQSWAAVLVKERQSQIRALKAMQAVGMEPSPEMLGFIDSLPEDEGDGYREYRQITQRFRALGDDGHRLLVMWNTLTATSHGNAATAMLFLADDGQPDSVPIVKGDPQYGQDRLFLLAVALDCLLLGLDAMNSMIDGHPALAGIQAIHDRKAALETQHEPLNRPEDDQESATEG
jgi:hypothetical protein